MAEVGGHRHKPLHQSRSSAFHDKDSPPTEASLSPFHISPKKTHSEVEAVQPRLTVVSQPLA